jgi:hypothetical protein
MFKRFVRLPSPALVISMLALALVLGGTAVAATTSVHADKKADIKLIKQLAPTLSVKHAKTAGDAAKLGGAPPSTYAHAAALSFIAPSLANSWTAASGFLAPGYTIDQFGTVHLKGAVVHTGTSNATIFTLPAGYIPSAAVDLAAGVYGPATGVVKIESDGTVHPTAVTTFVDLDGLTFTTGG